MIGSGPESMNHTLSRLVVKKRVLLSMAAFETPAEASMLLS
jgi:hypothetical protein